MSIWGKSWAGIIINPIGYLVTRKSPEKAAREYLEKNPTSSLINDTDTELSFKEDSRAWVDACAAKVKSDDVGTSIANAQKNCQAVFDNDTNVIYIKDYLVQKAAEEQAEVKKKVEEGVKSAFVLIGIFLFAGIIFYLLTSND